MPKLEYDNGDTANPWYGRLYDFILFGAFVAYVVTLAQTAASAGPNIRIDISSATEIPFPAITYCQIPAESEQMNPSNPNKCAVFQTSASVGPNCPPSNSICSGDFTSYLSGSLGSCTLQPGGGTYDSCRFQTSCSTARCIKCFTVNSKYITKPSYSCSGVTDIKGSLKATATTDIFRLEAALSNSQPANPSLLAAEFMLYDPSIKPPTTESEYSALKSRAIFIPEMSLTNVHLKRIEYTNVKGKMTPSYEITSTSVSTVNLKNANVQVTGNSGKFNNSLPTNVFYNTDPANALPGTYYQTAVLNIDFPSMQVEKRTEYILYDATYIVGAIGGIIGLLLSIRRSTWTMLFIRTLPRTIKFVDKETGAPFNDSVILVAGSKQPAPNEVTEMIPPAANL